MSTTNDSRRWTARPLVGIGVRLLSYALPVATSVLAAAALTSLLPTPTSTSSRVVTALVVLGGSSVVLLLTELAARRLLPLSTLLRMTMVFPDTAPSRYRVARSAGRVRDIEEQVRRAREEGLSDEPVVAATELLTLIAALSKHDRGTRGHAERTRVFVDMLAEEMGLPQEDRDRLRWAALLHDIGKLHVPSKVLNKPGRPDDHEWELLQSHPARGMEVASALHDFLGPWADTIHHHHERFDGTGYPQQLAGDEISLGGRIVAVADAFEVMTAARPYKQPMTATEAREELTRCAGDHFDPAIVRAFLELSMGRIRWTIGPVSWLAQSPLLLRTGSRVLDAGAALSRGAAAVAVGGAAVVTGPAAADSVPDRAQDDVTAGEDAAAEAADTAVAAGAPARSTDTTDTTEEAEAAEEAEEAAGADAADGADATDDGDRDDAPTMSPDAAPVSSSPSGTRSAADGPVEDPEPSGSRSRDDTATGPQQPDAGGSAEPAGHDASPETPDGADGSPDAPSADDGSPAPPPDDGGAPAPSPDEPDAPRGDEPPPPAPTPDEPAEAGGDDGDGDRAGGGLGDLLGGVVDAVGGVVDGVGGAVDELGRGLEGQGRGAVVGEEGDADDSPDEAAAEDDLGDELGDELDDLDDDLDALVGG